MHILGKNARYLGGITEKFRTMTELRPKRTRTLIRPEFNMYEEEEGHYDEKENEVYQAPKGPFGKINKTAEPLKVEKDDKVLHLSQYWPYGTGKDSLPQDKTLLYLYSFKAHKTCTAQTTNGEVTELVRLYKYSSPIRTYSEYVPFESHPEKLSSFPPISLHRSFPQMDPIKVQVVLRHVNCPDNAKCFDDCIKFRSPLFKIFSVNEEILVYLKIDESTIPLIPKELDFELQLVYNEVLAKYFGGNSTGIDSNNFLPSDASDFPEAEVPNGFKLKLRDYQLRTISWMKSIEAVKGNDKNTIYHYVSSIEEEWFIKVKLGDTPYYLGNYFEEESNTRRKEPVRFFGGILADDTGAGKTITTLGFIHSTPMTSEEHDLRMKRFRGSLLYYIQSRATCIICPSNIYKQWLDEATKCNPNFKIYCFSNMNEQGRICWEDLIDADIVVVTRQFLVNLNYATMVETVKFDNAQAELADFGKEEGRVVLHKIHFHRVILDEFHELSEVQTAMKDAIKSIRGDYHWGLTGTPKDNPFEDLAYLNPPERLSKVCDGKSSTHFEFIRKHIKRNCPDFKLPEIEQETIWIDLSARESALMKWKRERIKSTRLEIMMCSHYQLSENNLIETDGFVTVEEAQKRMCKEKEEEIDKINSRLVQQRSHIQEVLEKEPEKNVNYLETSIKSTETELQSAKSSLNYFQSVFKVICEPNANECRICYENINESRLSILPCSHLFCYDCIFPFIVKSHSCPLCRHRANLSDIYKIRIKAPEELPETLKRIDTSKYSSKLIGFYHYITELIRSDKEARIILFLQYSDLAGLIAKSLKELNVQCVRVVGSVSQRQNAIMRFRNITDVRLIMLSSEDSVSGINLTEATHVILLHPFWTGKGEEVDLAYEKQGISRAYRFGLNHPLKVVRFAVRGTIEEEITLKRQNIKY